MPINRTHTPLRISPTPFKSSFLSIPPSPFSPRTPLTPPLRPRLSNTNAIHSTHCQPGSTIPARPLAWVWTCHQCHRSYHLGVTRRCLDDGHHFCAGTTTVKQWRRTSGAPRVKRHRACASEFDYQGWKDWGRWQRGGEKTNPPAKNCWARCDYPSECRWGRQYGVHTPVDMAFPTLEVACSRPVEGVLKAENARGEKKAETSAGGFWGALLATAERKKTELAASPLATVAEEPEPGLSLERECAHPVDSDGDVLMTTIDPALLTLPSPPPPTLPTRSGVAATSAAVNAASAAVDSLKALITTKKTKRGRSLRLGRGCSGRTHAVPLLTVPRPVVLRPDEQIKATDPEALLDGFAPLERVASRDSGYASVDEMR